MNLDLDWNKFENNTKSRELSFESFINQIIRKKYSKYGNIEDYYNTPGSEIYLTLNVDCEDLKLKKGDVVGWQVKFWLNHKDDNNSELGKSHRDELIENLKTTLKYKANLNKWIVCTPGKFNNNKIGEKMGSYDSLKKMVCAEREDIILEHWHKEMYEQMYHDDCEGLRPIICHYFGSKFIGMRCINDYTINKIEYLEEKFDIDLYESNEADNLIESLVKFDNDLLFIKKKVEVLKRSIEQIRGNEFYAFNDFKLYKSVYIHNIKSLLDNRINLAEFIVNRLEIADHINIDIRKDIILELESANNDYNEIIKTLKGKKKIDKKIKRTDNEMSQELWHERNCYDFYVNQINNIYEQLVEKDHGLRGEKIINLIDRAAVRHVHVFGDAGQGKTNLACSICQKLVKANFPALLILASELRSDNDLKEQIMSLIDIPRDYTFHDFLSSLNDLGFAKKIKIPVVIDGLNETCPSSGVWNTQINDMVSIFNKFENIILITTCRDRYVEQIFNKKNYLDVENNIYLSGFNDNNIDYVIAKYFEKYKIEVRDKNFDKDLLKKPIILKMFSVVNKGKIVASVDPFNIYKVIEEYFETIIRKIATVDGNTNKILEERIKKRLGEFSKCLWLLNARSMEYCSEEFINIFDPDYSERENIQNTISYKMIDEGVFIKEMIGKDEHIVFCYDLLGGYYIAKSVLLNFANKEDIVNELTLQETLNKIGNLNAKTNHPLREDILKACAYLLPVKIGKQIYEVIPSKDVIRDFISLIDLITATPGGKKNFMHMVSAMRLNDKNIVFLMDIILQGAVRNGNYHNVDILVDILERMKPAQIDFLWSELLRKNRRDIIIYLDSLNSDTCIVQKNDNLICFVALLTLSPDKLLRDTATKTLVVAGERMPNKLYDTLKEVLNINDLYIIERVLCSIYGVVLLIDNKQLTYDICTYIEETLIKALKTNHILILDYCNMILGFTEHKYGRKPAIDVFYFNKEERWIRDKDCEEGVKSEDWATFGYGPVDMDFAKHEIGTVASMGYYKTEAQKTPALKDCLAMVIWKMKKNGYEQKIIDSIAKKMQGEERYRNAIGILDYKRKYASVALYELYGYFMVNGLLKPEYGSGFRGKRLDIDPTFPEIRKRQLITECFYPEKGADLQQWINEDKAYLNKYYNYQDDGSEWILLDAALSRKSDEIEVNLSVKLSTYIVDSDACSDFIHFMNDNMLMSDFGNDMVPERCHMFLGEFSWSDNMPADIQSVKIGDKNIPVHCPCCEYNWESLRSEKNIFNRFTVLNKSLVDKLNIHFNPKKMSYHDENGREVVKYISDEYSNFLYIKKYLLAELLRDLKGSLVFHEYGSRQINWDNKNRLSFKPSFVDFNNISSLELV